jgi:N-acetyl-anhydromuramyl-L-alanine amidase AmpD
VKIEVKDITGFKSSGKHKKKKQIILSHTSRNINDYISSLKYRHNGEYKKIPNFIIDRNGVIYRLISENDYSNFFLDSTINKNGIIICLENLGWLEKIPLNDGYVNWIGDIYNEQVFEKKWRDYFFWQPYTEKQILACANLCSELLDIFSIDKKCIGHNVKSDKAEKFEGIVSKSNFDSDFTDISPAFDFESFFKKIEHEQLV